MKKNYFLTFLLTLCFSAFSFGQSVTITAIIDGKAPSDGCSGTSGSSSPKAIELYVSGTIDFTGYKYEVEANGSSSGETWTSEDISALGSRTNEFVYIVTTGETTLYEMYTGATNANTHAGGSSFNGNDAIRITDGTNVLDQFGNPSDVTGSSDHDNPWEFEDSYATRKDGSSSNAGTFNLSNWNIPGRNYFDDNSISTCAAMLNEVKFGTYSTTASTTPSLKIDSPADNSTINYTANPVVKFTVTNFNVAAGGAGDGFIKWKLDDAAQADKTDTSDITFVATAGTTYKVYIELVDNSGNPLGTPVNQTVNFTVNHPCDLVLADITTMCDALTSGADTFNGSIDFTGGNTGVTYTITAVDKDDNNVSVGTIGGDNPNTATSGKITITGIPEGKDVTVKIVGDATSSCDYSRNLFSPTCIPFPVVDAFDYTADTDLTASANWQTSSTSTDKVKVVTGTIGNPFSSEQFPNPTGNMVSFDGVGADPYIEFYQQNTGIVYASFIFTATDVSGLTNTNGGYFAVLTQASGSYKGRLWLRQDTTDNAKYNIGVTAGSSGATYNSTMQTPGEEVFIVMGYDFSSNELKVWIDPDPASFSGTIPAETLKVTASGNDIPTDLGRFLLRQDSGTETPAINFDELRISTSWADVTPKGSTASVGENLIDGFAAYPNPVKNGRLTVTSTTADVKNVSIYNVLGRKVFSQNITGTSKQLNISSITSGVYILKVVEGTKSSTKKLVVR